jgi:hypothetical protein
MLLRAITIMTVKNEPLLSRPGPASAAASTAEGPSEPAAAGRRHAGLCVLCVATILLLYSLAMADDTETRYITVTVTQIQSAQFKHQEWP